MSSTASTAVHVTLPSAHHSDRILKTINRINYCIHVHLQVFIRKHMLYSTSEDGVKLLGVNCTDASFDKACMTACFSNCRCEYMEKLLQDMHVHMTESIMRYM